MAKQQNTEKQKPEKDFETNKSKREKIFSRLKDIFRRVVFAEGFECLHCGAEISENSHFYLCEKCFNSLNFIQNACDICGDKISSFDIICNRCKEVSHNFTKAFCVAKYEGTALSLVQKLKYGEGKYLSSALGKMMAEKLKISLSQSNQNSAEKPPFHSFQNFEKASQNFAGQQWQKVALKLADIDFVVPVPLNKNRLKKRGYNQSFLLAKAVANECDLSILPHLIRRIKNTPTQTSLPIKERRDNVKNAFEIVDCNAVKNATILLVDDIVTTGATTDEIARILLKHHAKAVFVLAFCHA